MALLAFSSPLSCIRVLITCNHPRRTLRPLLGQPRLTPPSQPAWQPHLERNSPRPGWRSTQRCMLQSHQRRILLPGEVVSVRLSNTLGRRMLGRDPAGAYPLRRNKTNTVSTLVACRAGLLAGNCLPATERVTTGGCFSSDISHNGGRGDKPCRPPSRPLPAPLFPAREAERSPPRARLTIPRFPRALALINPQADTSQTLNSTAHLPTPPDQSCPQPPSPLHHRRRPCSRASMRPAHQAPLRQHRLTRHNLNVSASHHSPSDST